MSIVLQPAPITTPVVDKQGRLSLLWSRYFIQSTQAITVDAAPADAPYWIGSATAALTAARNLALLATGYLKLTVGAGVAVPSTTTTIPATDLSGTIPDARFPATLPALSGVNLTALNATNLGSGTVPDARFPATLPASSGVNLTALNATQLTSGTLPSARLGSPLPALDGSALTALTGSHVTHAVVTITAVMSPYVVLSSDETLLVNATAGAVAVTLPTATAGRTLAVKKIDASANVVTLTGTVDGTVNPTLGTQYDARLLQGDGTVWYLIGKV
jgi:hypothetical protein